MDNVINFEEAKLETQTYKKRQIKAKNDMIIIRHLMKKGKKVNDGPDGAPDRSA